MYIETGIENECQPFNWIQWGSVHILGEKTILFFKNKTKKNTKKRTDILLENIENIFLQTCY